MFRPLPRRITRSISIVVVLAWVAAMGILINRTYLQASTTNLATDLARYGSSAIWRGIYYRGEKVGFTVSQTVPKGDGFELEEDGRLQMSLLGATTPATIRTRARVDSTFTLRSFDFSLDPGTGPVKVDGVVLDRRISLTVSTRSGTQKLERTLNETPALMLNMSRRLANGGLIAGARHQWTIFDPATLHNAPVVLDVGKREFLRVMGKPMPAFRVQMEFSGLNTTSWITDTGEVVREESPLGLLTVRESPETARAMAVPASVRADLLNAAAIEPIMEGRIDEPRDVRRLRMRVDGANLSAPDVQGVAQSVRGNVVEIQDPQRLRAERADPAAQRYLDPEPLIESDAPEIRAEAERAVAGVANIRERAERLTRYVNALLDKKPTISLPSAREVLRTRVGDCNEHTALYVAMARALGIPARIAVGLVFVRGAFYYHAWPEVYLTEADGRGLWLPVDPTLNEFPADATHLRLVRGGLDRQVEILPLIGRIKITVLDVELAPNSTPILVGRQPIDLGPLAIPIPRRETCCACPAPQPPTR